MKEAKFTFTILALILLFLTSIFWESDIMGFHVPSWVMGVGIAIDVFLATISKFQDRELSFRNWTLPICATHIGFPAFGYFVVWGLGQAYPWLHPILGSIGFVLVALFVYEVICSSAGKEPIFGISSWVSNAIGLDENDTRRIIAILAVSWDALWSGPAKAAQASAGHWTTPEVIASFAIAGVVVAMVAQIALMFALKLQEKQFDDVYQMAKWSFNGKIAELSVIGGFGVLSLLGGFAISESIWLSIVIAAVVVFLTFQLLEKSIMTEEMEAAEEAIFGETDDTDHAAA